MAESLHKTGGAPAICLDTGITDVLASPHSRTPNRSMSSSALAAL